MLLYRPNHAEVRMPPAILMQRKIRVAALVSGLALLLFFSACMICYLALAGKSKSPSLEQHGATTTRELAQASQLETQHGRVDSEGESLPSGAISRLNTIRFRHGGTVNSLCISPDGTALVSGGTTRYVTLWDPSSGSPLRQFLHEDKDVLNYSVHFSRDGRSLITKGVRQICLWDIATAKLRRTFGADGVPIESLAVSPDGRALAFSLIKVDTTKAKVDAVRTGFVKVVDLATGRELRCFGTHAPSISSIAYSTDTKTILTASRGNGKGTPPLVRCWDAANGVLRSEIILPYARLASLRFSPDGTKVAVFAKDEARPNAKGLHVWDIQSRKQLAFHPTAEDAEIFTFSPNGKCLAFHPNKGPLSVWDFNADHQVCQFDTEPSVVTSLAFTPDGTSIFSGDFEGVLRRWDIRTSRGIGRSDTQKGFVDAVEFSPDAKTIAFAGRGDSIHLFESRTGKQVRTFSLGQDTIVRNLSFALGGTFLVAGDDNRGITFWELATGNEVQLVTQPATGWGHPALSRDGKFLAALTRHSGIVNPNSPPSWGAPLSGDIQVWNLAEKTKTKHLAGPFPVIPPIVFSPDGHLLASGGSKLYDSQPAPFNGSTRSPSPVVLLWDLKAGKLARICFGAHGGASSLTFSHDGHTLAAACADGTVRLWTAADGSLRSTFRVCNPSPFRFRLTFANDLLVTANSYDDIQLWKLGNASPVMRLKGHFGSLTSLSASPDASLLASGGADTCVLVWDLTAARKSNPPDP